MPFYKKLQKEWFKRKKEIEMLPFAYQRELETCSKNEAIIHCYHEILERWTIYDVEPSEDHSLLIGYITALYEILVNTEKFSFESETDEFLNSANEAYNQVTTTLRILKNDFDTYKIDVQLINTVQEKNKIVLDAIEQEIAERMIQEYEEDDSMDKISLFRLNETITEVLKCLRNLSNNSDFDSLKNGIKKYDETLSSFDSQEHHFTFSDNEDLYAAENNRLKKELSQTIKAINSKDESNLNEDILQLIKDLKKLEKETLPIKIYGLHSSITNAPYPVEDKTVKYSPDEPSEWEYLGYAKTYNEALAYMTLNTSTYIPSIERGVVNHLNQEPDEDNWCEFFKIEAGDFTEYFDYWAEGPIHQAFKFRKRETRCHFCDKPITGKEYDTHSIIPNWKREDLYVYFCCKDCYEKYVDKK